MRTIAAAKAMEAQWDVLIVGAGLAGAVAAHQLALRKHRVLLIERETFPRYKVCGCCLNARALRFLRDLGLSHLPPKLGASTLDSVRLMTAERRVTLPIPDGLALSREKLDAAIVSEAVLAGAHFLDGTPVSRIEDDGTDGVVHTSSGLIRGRIVISAGGLGGNLCSQIPSIAAPASRIGAGMTFEARSLRIEPTRIYMGVGREGYVGLVRLEDGRLNIGAALDPAFVKLCGGLRGACQSIISRIDSFPVRTLGADNWRGTPALTRRTVRHAKGRIFLIGDASGYVEPFTGEGMSWALESAWDVLPYIDSAVSAQHPDEIASAWHRSRKRKLLFRQLPCRATASILRRPRALRLAVGIAAGFPSAIGPLLSLVSGSDLLPPIREEATR